MGGCETRLMQASERKGVHKGQELEKIFLNAGSHILTLSKSRIVK